MSPEDLAWAAGFIDGDGCIQGVKDPQLRAFQSGYECPEVLKRLASIFPQGKIYGPYTHKSYDSHNRKPQWYFIVSGFEYFQFVVTCLWKHLSSHRKRQAETVLRNYHQDRAVSHSQRVSM